MSYHMRRRLDDRRAEAMERDAAQLEKLEREGHGHCREADRLRAKKEKKGEPAETTES